MRTEDTLDDIVDDIGVVAREAARVEELVRGSEDLTVPVAHCGDWTAYDLVTHLGGVHRWAAAATTTPPQGRVAGVEEPQGLAAVALADWFAQGAAGLLAALAGDPARPCWTLAEPRTVAFWRRRQAHETTMHRWDLETALGLPATIAPGVAADGVDEVLDVMIPRQVRLGRLDAGPAWVRLVVEGRERTLATGAERADEPVATITGTGAAVLLLLWGRGGLDALTVDGDLDGLATFLRGALTP